MNIISKNELKQVIFFVALKVSRATTAVLQILFYCNLFPVLDHLALGSHIDFLLIILVPNLIIFYVKTN